MIDDQSFAWNNGAERVKKKIAWEGVAYTSPKANLISSRKYIFGLLNVNTRGFVHKATQHFCTTLLHPPHVVSVTQTQLNDSFHG